MSMECYRCGAMNPNDSAFCQKCGTPLNIPQEIHTKQESVRGEYDFQRWTILSSPDPFPDDVSKLKVFDWITLIGIFLLILCLPTKVGILQKLGAGLIFGLVGMFVVHMLVVNTCAGIKSMQLDSRKFGLPSQAADSTIAGQTAPCLIQAGMQVSVNQGVTKGLYITCGGLNYKVDFNRTRGYFTVSLTAKVYLSTYICMIRDIPKIVYVIQQTLIR